MLCPAWRLEALPGQQPRSTTTTSSYPFWPKPLWLNCFSGNAARISELRLRSSSQCAGAMYCPFCKRHNWRRDWSDSQWLAQDGTGSPFVDVNGRPRNCCKTCSDEVGEYFTARCDAGRHASEVAPPPPPGPPPKEQCGPSPPPPPGRPARPSKDELRAQLDGAHSWLAQNVKGKFWVDMKAWFDEQNQTYRDLLCSRNIRDGLSEHKTFLKRTSYAGAVRLPTWCPDGWTTYTCPVTNRRYGDLGNATYLEFMMLVWPDSLRELGISNESTAGDLIEALLGWHYILTIKRGQTVGDLANDTIEMLELGAVAVCALWEAK